MSKLIGEGGYGCVYWPKINCDGSKGTVKYVTKIQKKNQAAENEFFIGKILKTIKHYKNYFKPVIHVCNLDITKINQHNFSKCDILKKNSNKKFIAMQIPYLERNNIDTFYLNKNYPLAELISSCMYLIKTIHILNGKKIIHYDLKQDNILMDYLGIPYLIDFGISIPLKDIKNNLYKYFYVYAPDYTPWCFEINLMNYIVNYKDIDNDIFHKSEIENVISQFIDQNKVFTYFSDKFRENYKNYLKTYYNNIIFKDNKSKTTGDMIDILLSTCFTWDNFSLAIFYIKLINKVKKKIHSLKVINFIEILTMLIHPNPEKRPKYKELKNELNKIETN